MKIRKELFASLGMVVILFMMAFQGTFPLNILMNWGASFKSKQVRNPDFGEYEFFTTLSDEEGVRILLDIKSGQHFWHPQLAVWAEDTLGNFIKTLFVTESTAKGLFLSGRTATNFKSFDEAKSDKVVVRSKLRLVDALPYWSHKRGIEVLPNFFAPTLEHPVVDGITGATPGGNFYIQSLLPSDIPAVKIMLEVNVAFDDNAYYSEYDFPEDSLYHGGTGLLGQPSLIYESLIIADSMNRSYLMKLVGHSHHSGQNGNLYKDLGSMTTALQIIDRVVVSVD